MALELEATRNPGWGYEVVIYASGTITQRMSLKDESLKEYLEKNRHLFDSVEFLTRG